MGAATVAGRVRDVVDGGRCAVTLTRHPHHGLEALHRRFGTVAHLGIGSWGATALMGAEANRVVLGHSELFRWREAMEPLIVVDGDTALIVSDGAEHQRRRRLVTPAFSPRRIAGYATVMRSRVDAAIDRWRPGQEVDLQERMRAVVRASTIEVLFGARLAADEARIGALIDRAVAVIERPPPLQRLQRLGLPSWRRAVAARAAVADLVHDEIGRRRHGPTDGQGDDVLGALLAARDDDGARLDDHEITDQVISLIAAGFETTSAALGWACHALLTDPALTGAAGTELLDRGTEGRWRRLDGFVSETLRLWPPAAVVPRHVVEPFSVDGHDIAAGRLVMVSPYLTHRDPALWSRPEHLDPDRWAPGGARPAAHEYLPFGGGPHRCLGAAFATTEMTVLLERLLQRTTLRLEHADPTPVTLSATRPRPGPDRPCEDRRRVEPSRSVRFVTGRDRIDGGTHAGTGNP